MDIYRSTQVRNKANTNMRMKASSLYFLNNISNIDTVDASTITENWRDSYTFNPIIIGRGHFSKVYKVKCCSTGNNAAIKIIRRRRLGTDKIDEIMQEIEIMQLLNRSSNSGFIQLLKVHTTPSEVAIVMEYASGGSLFHVTQDSKTGLPEVYVKIVLTKILSALSLIHRHDIVHLDIKADNVLLRHPYQSTDVVFIDFGLARKLTKSKVHKEMIGTPDYIAPEVLNYEQICLKSDMWSLGVLAYFLMTNVSPFSADTKEETLNRVTMTQFEFVGNLQDENMHLARDFISKLLVKVPEHRLSADECMQHDFLVNVPIVECTQDKSPSPEAPIIAFDYKVHVRQNMSHQTRGMVMSQYDICSSDMNNMLNDNLTANSVDGLDYIVSESKNEKLLSQSLDQVNDNVQISDKVAVDEVDVSVNCSQKIPIDMLICHIMENESETGFFENTNDEASPKSDPCDDWTTNDKQDATTNPYNECKQCEDSGNNNFGIDSNITDDLENAAFESNQSKSQNCEQEIPDNANFSRITVRESRRRLKQSVSISFRNSQNNVIDQNNNDNIHNHAVHSIEDLTDLKLPSSRKTNGVTKRIHLSQSLKRDSDKPQPDKYNRRSQHYADNLDKEMPSNSNECIKPTVSLKVTRTESKKYSSKSKSSSNPRPKVQKKSPFSCVIS